MAILHHLRKPKAKCDIIFEEDLEMDDDGWFITVKHVQRNNGKITRESCIILKNVSAWLDPYLREGYVDLTTETNQS
jgi:hypothetical protein